MACSFEKQENQSLCPVCDRIVAASVIEEHCNAHFDDAAISQGGLHDRRDFSVPITTANGAKPDASPATQLQPASRQHLAGNFITMLCKALEAQQGVFTTAVCGDLDHYQTEGADAGWGCGYKNLQMLASHLQTQDQAMADALFGGVGYVPDVPSLQILLENAWALGWDRVGCEQLGGKVCGTRSWIGATECAALLCACGIRAKVVDFDGGRSKVLEEWAAGRPHSGSEKGGGGTPADAKEIHPGVECDSCGMFPVSGPCYNSQSRANYDLCEVCHSRPEALAAAPYCHRQGRASGEEIIGPALVRWVWRHFTEEYEAGRQRRSDDALHRMMDSARLRRVIRTNKPPLYFQHQGHSRTIVGIEKRINAGAEEFSLLVLDPHERSKALSDALQAGRGWQRMLKRGMHTLREPEYQLVYIDGLMASTEEREDSKIIHAVHF